MLKEFEKFESERNENPLPSLMIPLEIERWQKFKQEIQHRNKKQLYIDRNELLELLTGPTHPISRAYEFNPSSRIEYNPLYNRKHKSFPLWHAIYLGVYAIGYGKTEAPTYVKNAIIASTNRLIRFLQRLDFKKLDAQVIAFNIRLNAARNKAIAYAVENRILYKPILSYQLSLKNK
jgi:hypothetical protein